MPDDKANIGSCCESEQPEQELPVMVKVPTIGIQPKIDELNESLPFDLNHRLFEDILDCLQHKADASYEIDCYCLELYRQNAGTSLDDGFHALSKAINQIGTAMLEYLSEIHRVYRDERLKYRLAKVGPGYLVLVRQDVYARIIQDEFGESNI